MVTSLPPRCRALRLFLLLAPLAACASLQPAPQAMLRPTCPHIPKPPDIKRPLPPVSAFPQVLQPGHWDWSDGNYVWTPPQWQARFTKIAPRWVDGHWEANGGACIWHNGRFVPAG
jgi:hypothetical protein